MDLRGFVLALTLIIYGDVAARYLYLGCFEDVEKVKTPWTKLYTNATGMGVKVCQRICSQYSNHLAVLHDGQQCYCITALDQSKSVLLQTSENRCNTYCPNAPSCGGNNVLAVHKSESQAFLGCFNNQPFNKDTIEMFVDSESLTVEKCAKLCNGYYYNFTVLSEGNKCSCANHLPHWNTTDELCLTYGLKCSGAERCGGKDALSLWKDIDYSETTDYANVIEKGSFIRNYSRYVGCRKQLKESHELWWNGPYSNLLDISVNWCLGICWQRGFDFSGLKKGTKCYCLTTDEILYEFHSESTGDDCGIKCKGGAKCGGDMILALYEVTDATFIGCFENVDKNGNGLALHITTSLLTPYTCLTSCRDIFKYAGVEDGDKCYCGNQIPLNTSQTTDSLCLIYGEVCPGTDTCGGHNAIDLWQIGDYTFYNENASRAITSEGFWSLESKVSTIENPSRPTTSEEFWVVESKVSKKELVLIGVGATALVVLVLIVARCKTKSRVRSIKNHSYENILIGDQVYMKVEAKTID